MYLDMTPDLHFTDKIDLASMLPRQDDLLAGTTLHLGYPDVASVTGKVMDHITAEIDKCRELAAPRCITRAMAFDRLSGSAIHGASMCIESVNWKRLTARMTGAQWICCLAVTLGDAIDAAIRELGKTAMLKALVLDAAASFMVEHMADHLQAMLHGHYEQQGLAASARFSPGYCDWPMKEGQRELFPFLDPGKIGISATSDGLMTPRKSITAAMIVADQMPAPTPCFLCARDCDHRRAPYAENSQA